MEKYARWSDRRTGINPFFPLKIAPSTPERLFIYSLGIPLTLLRTTLILVVTVLYAVLRIPIDVAPRIPFVSRLLERIVDVVFARTLLFLMGFFWVSENCINPTKRAGTQPPIARTCGPHDVILTNHISYVEVLYLLYRWSPVFVTCYDDVDRSSDVNRVGCEDEKFGKLEDAETTVVNGVVYVMTWMDLWMDTIYLRNAARPAHADGRWCEINSVIAQSNKPIVLMLEGTTSNGKSLLRVQSILSADHTPPLNVTLDSAHVIGFKASAQAIYIGVESVLWHFLRLCAYPTNELEMKILAAEAVPSPPTSNAKLEEWLKWEREWWDAQAHCLRVPRISLTAADKRGFIDAWRKGR